MDTKGFPSGTSSKEPDCYAGAAGDGGLIPGLGRFPGGGHGNPLQYSCLENLMDRRVWQGMVHRVAKSWTRLKRLSMHAHECKIHSDVRKLSFLKWRFKRGIKIDAGKSTIKASFMDF